MQGNKYEFIPFVLGSVTTLGYLSPYYCFEMSPSTFTFHLYYHEQCAPLLSLPSKLFHTPLNHEDAHLLYFFD